MGATPLFGKCRIKSCTGCREFYPLDQLKFGRCLDCSDRNRILGSLPRDNYDSYEIAERDNWICGICNEGIDPFLTNFTDPGYLNVDHIIPVTAPHFPGDIRSNLQASHRICNIKKGGYKP